MSDGFTMLHVRGEPGPRAFSNHTIADISMYPEGNVVIFTNGKQLPLVDSDNDVANATGIAQKVRVLIELTPKVARNGKNILVTPETFATLQCFETHSVIALPDGNTVISVQETRAQLEPVLNHHGIVIRKVTDYQNQQPKTTEILIF